MEEQYKNRLKETTGVIFDALPDAYSDSFWASFRNEAAENRIPIHGHFELTPRCNFDCKMCYVHLNPDQMECSELSYQDWISIIDKAIESGMIVASLSGGECLTVPFFDDLYLYLKNRGIFVFILTNGFLLSNKIDLFTKHPPAHIQVSVYGWDEESYSKVTGVKAFKRVDDAILELNRRGVSISVAVTASRYLSTVYQIVQHFYELNIGVTVSKWLIPPYEVTGRCLDDFNLTPEEQVKIELEILQATDQTIPETLDEELPIPGGQEMTRYYGLTCAAGRTDFSINWRGEMTPCVSLPQPTGYPLTNGFTDSWMKTVAYCDSLALPIECSGCAYKPVCKRCYASHLIGTESAHCNPNACEEVKLMVQKGLLKISLEV